MTEKECTKCKEVKPLDQFSKDKKAKDGLRYWCRSCRSHQSKLFSTRDRDPERARENNRKWREANKERIAESTRAWKKANPDVVRRKKTIDNHRRRAMKACAVPQRWVKSDCPDTNCYWCGVDLSTVSVHLEHLMPLSLGGPAIKSNEAPACRSCNLSKSNKHPLVWLALQF